MDNGGVRKYNAAYNACLLNVTYCLLLYLMLFVCIMLFFFFFLLLIFANAFCFHALSWSIDTVCLFKV